MSAAPQSAPDLHPLNHGFEWPAVTGPFKFITDAQAESYNSRGYFVLERALDAATVARAIDAIDPYEARVESYLRAQPGRRALISEADGISFTVHLVKRSSVLRELSAAPLFAGLCRDLIGPEVRLYWDQAVYKKPEYPKLFPWHQDNAYTYIEPQAYLTCWIALTDVTEDNGCPWVIPGGHLRGTLAHRWTDLGHVCREADGAEAIAVPAPAGSIVVFSSLMPHRTGPNLTREVRKAYILQYAPDGARVAATGALCDAPDRQYFVVRDGQRVAPPPLAS
jgi:ectoine hydroxylase-related dioxygenase (phytanoyl-CoA dioxygenase family)